MFNYKDLPLDLVLRVCNARKNVFPCDGDELGATAEKE